MGSSEGIFAGFLRCAKLEADVSFRRIGSGKNSGKICTGTGVSGLVAAELPMCRGEYLCRISEYSMEGRSQKDMSRRLAVLAVDRSMECLAMRVCFNPLPKRTNGHKNVR